MASYKPDGGDVPELAHLRVMYDVRLTKIKIEDGYNKKRRPLKSCLRRRPSTEPSQTKNKVKIVRIIVPQKSALPHPAPETPMSRPPESLQSDGPALRQHVEGAPEQRLPGLHPRETSVRKDALIKANDKKGQVNEVLDFRIMVQMWRAVYNCIPDPKAEKPCHQRLIRGTHGIKTIFCPLLL
ncbi:hypothetical protein ACJZ2D_001541 [Fusarium nematophilum]